MGAFRRVPCCRNGIVAEEVGRKAEVIRGLCVRRCEDASDFILPGYLAKCWGFWGAARIKSDIGG